MKGIFAFAGGLLLVLGFSCDPQSRQNSQPSSASPRPQPRSPAKLSDEEDIPPEIAEGVRKNAAVKAKALKNAKVKVLRAYEYVGPTTIEPIAIAKTIAVDVEFAGYTDWFKIWDVDIVDAGTRENFGSDPDVGFLDAKGKFISFEVEDIAFMKPMRLLLIYAVRKATKSIKLSYWGQELTPKPIRLQAQGLLLPKRK